MPILHANAIELHYQHLPCDTTSNPPLLLLSGMASDGASWQPVIESLNMYFELIIPDNRCCGQTLPNPVQTNRDLMVSDIAALLDKLELEKVNVLGHSMGAMLGWAIASTHPTRVNHLISASAVPCVIPARLALFDVLSTFRTDQNEADWFELLFQFLFSPAFFEDRAAVKAAVANSIAYEHKQHADSFAMQVAGLHSFADPMNFDATQSKLEGKVEYKVTSITGENDILMTPALLQQHCPEFARADCHVIAKAAHAIHWEQPKEFCNLVIKSLMQSPTAHI